MPRAFITGATGFVGSHIARQLCQQGYDVRILRRESSKLDAISDLAVEHVIGDLFDIDQLTDYLTDVDYVFHVAAVSEYWRSSKSSIYRVNVDGTRNLLLAAEAAGVKRFIFTSSGQAIGYFGGGRVVDETTHFNIDPHITPYGHSKFLAEAEVYQAIDRGLDAIIMNPAIVLGPGDLNLISGSIIVEVARGSLPVMPQHGGTNFIDVRDVAAAHIAGIEKGRCGERYIVGSVNMTHRAMIRIVCDVVGQPEPKIPMPKAGIGISANLVDFGRAIGLPIPAEGNQLRLSSRDIYMDVGKMRRELHQPEIDVRQSIEDTYQWYLANGYL